METHRQSLLSQAKTNVKTAPHPAAAKRIADRAKDTLLVRAARRGSLALAKTRQEIVAHVPQDMGGSLHRHRASYEVPHFIEDAGAAIPPSFADLV